MPEVCRFLGISILMYFNDHSPAHIHVRYNDDRATVRIDDCAVLSGRLPPRVLGLVTEWANLHREELRRNWETLRESGEWQKIAPLV